MSEKIKLNTLSCFIIEEIRARKWSNQETARQFGVSEDELLDTLTLGKRFTDETCKRIAFAFNVTEEFIFNLRKSVHV